MGLVLTTVDGKMGMPCRTGNDCAVINTQRQIHHFTEQARRAASEAKDASRMTQATAVAREAASRVLNELLQSESQVASALVATENAEAAARVASTQWGEGQTRNSGFLSNRRDLKSHTVTVSLAAMRAADEATAAGIAAAAARAAARSHEGADASDAERARHSRDVRLIVRMAQEAEDALAIAEEDERQ